MKILSIYIKWTLYGYVYDIKWNGGIFIPSNYGPFVDYTFYCGNTIRHYFFNSLRNHQINDC